MENITQKLEQPPIEQMDQYSEMRLEEQQNLQKAVKFINSQHFSVQKILGRGSYGVVVQGKNDFLNSTFAIKIQSLAVENDSLADNSDTEKIKQERRQMLENETTILKSISHPNIVKTYNTIVNDDLYYIIMEECLMNLEQYLIQNIQHLNEEAILNIWKQLILGMKQLQEEKICLRDVKLENVLINNQGVVKYCDFGLSKQILDNMFTSTLFKIEGNFYSLPPEIAEVILDKQIKNVKEYLQAHNISQNQQADIWGLGIMMIQLGGAKPLQIMNYTLSGVPVYAPNVSKEANLFLQYVLNRERNNRPNILEIEKMYDQLIVQLQKNKETSSSLEQVNNLNKIQQSNHQDLKENGIKDLEIHFEPLDNDYEFKQEDLKLCEILKTNGFTYDNDITGIIKSLNRYNDYSLICAGKSQLVIKAFNTDQNNYLALKICKIEGDTSTIRIIEKQWKLIQEIKSPNIVKIYDMRVIQFVDQSFLIQEMELCDQTLKEFLEDVKGQRYNLSQNQKMGIMLQVISGINALHSKMVVHNQILTNKILIKKNNSNDSIEIKLSGLDFLTQIKDEDQILEAKTVLSLLIPECIQNQQNIKSDIWSLGLVLLRIDNYNTFSITKKHIEQLKNPYDTLLEGDTSINRNSNIYQVISKCLNYDYHNRPSIAEVVESISNL